MLRKLVCSLCSVLVLLCQIWAGACEQKGGGRGHPYVRPPASADLSLFHSRILRSSDAPHVPEQIHLAMAGVTVTSQYPYPSKGLYYLFNSRSVVGVGAMSIDWVTNPQEDDTLMQRSKSEEYCDRLQDLRLNTTVLYGTNSTALHSIGRGSYTCYIADEYQSGALHHAVLGLGPEGPLKASTEYHYQVGDPELALSELYSFTTPPEASSFPYRLGLIGDLGQTENSMDTLDHAATLEPISILNVGDLSYADGYQPRWASGVTAIQDIVS